MTAKSGARQDATNQPDGQNHAGHVGQINGTIPAPWPAEGRFAIATLRKAGIAMDALVRRTNEQERTAK